MKLQRCWVPAVYSEEIAKKKQTDENPFMGVYIAEDVDEIIEGLHHFIADKYDEHRKTRNLSKFTLQLKEEIETKFGKIDR